MKIVNIVTIVSLNTSLNLNLIHERIEGTEFPKKAHWLKMRLPPDNSYIAFYKSGKFLITQKEPARIEDIAKLVVKLLKDKGIKVKVQKIETHNMVFTHKVKLKCPLENLIANLNSKKASYEPEQFPALIYKDWGASFLLFSTGKMIITGVKTINEAELAIEKFKINIINI